MGDASAALDALGEDVGARFPAAPPAEKVLAPTTTEALAGILRTAAEHGLTVLPWGGGTHQGIGYQVNPHIVIVTTEMRSVVDWQPEDLTIVVEAGLAVSDLADLLAERGQSAVLPEVPGEATVGGVVAAGVSGWRRLAYGPTRDRMLEVVLVTGDGRTVTGGGRVVKNVSGYDIPRLATGSFGSLGIVTQVCLKLWPVAAHSATIDVRDAAAAAATAYHPLAVIETPHRSAVYVAGTSEEIAGQARDLGGIAMPGLTWPEPLVREHVFSLRTPPPFVAEAVSRVKSLPGDVTFQAAHGVGDVTLALDDLSFGHLVALRSWSESVGGALVTLSAPPGTETVFDPWGTPPSTVELQRRVKAAFDPVGILNPGRLPGRI